MNDLSVVHKNHSELVKFIKAGEGGNLSMVLLASSQQMPIPYTTHAISVTRGADGVGFILGGKGNVHYFKAVDAMYLFITNFLDELQHKVLGGPNRVLRRRQP